MSIPTNGDVALLLAAAEPPNRPTSLPDFHRLRRIVRLRRPSDGVKHSAYRLMTSTSLPARFGSHARFSEPKPPISRPGRTWWRPSPG
jgi:hypothetical protein